MFYDRKIKYLDCYERGERIKGCGFVKMEVRDDELRFEITVSGLRATDSFSREVLFCTEKQEKTLAKIALSQGRGELKRIYHNRSNVGGTGIAYWELCGICIRLDGEREISCRWQRSENKSAERLTAGDGNLRGQNKTESLPVEAWAENTVEKAGKADSESGLRPADSPGAVAEIGLHAAAAGQEVPPDKPARGREESPAGGNARVGGDGPASEPEQAKREGRPAKKAERLLEDKWQQLCAIYPHTQPFRDERDYLSIRPADFLLFPADVYRQANNSFLLHGYYNYKHLLLTRVEQRGEPVYYIGVPGNFYEKEKQVALMFGFESFECAEEPAQTGDFGYYMMRVQL